MDPGIMKFLEDDEDEHVHSGAEVDALTAALNRDIGGSTSIASVPDSEAHAENDAPSQGKPAASSASGTQQKQFTPQQQEEHLKHQQQWEEQCQQQGEQEEQLTHGEKQQHQLGEPSKQQEQLEQSQLQQSVQNELQLSGQSQQLLEQHQHQEQHPEVEQQQLQQPHQPQKQLQQQQHLPQPQQQQLQLQVQPQSQQQLQQPEQHSQQQQLQQQLQQLSPQQLHHQQPQQSARGPATSSTRRPNMASHSISFGSLIPMILPHISQEQSQRLQALYSRLRRNEVTKEDFLRATRNVVGDQMLVQAVRQMQHKQQTQSQSTQSSQINQQQQQSQQQLSQNSSQPLVPHQNLHSQQLNEPQPFQQVQSMPVNLQQQTQRTPDYQPLSHTNSSQSQADVSHPTLENNTQQSRQVGEKHELPPGLHMSQTSAMNLHQAKQELDRTVATFPPSNPQQQPNLQVSQSPFSLYGRTPGNYQTHAVKTPAQDSQTRQIIHPQGGIQSQVGSPQLLNIKGMPKYDISKVRNEARRREDEERLKRLQSGGASHFSAQSVLPQEQSVWSTSVDKEQAVSTGMPMSGLIKQEGNDRNTDPQHTGQSLQPITDISSGLKSASHAVSPSNELLLDQGQSLVQPKTEVGEHQSIKTSSITSMNIPAGNQPVGSTGIHSDHRMQVMQTPVATSGTASASSLHHSLPTFGGPISGGPPGIALQGQMHIQVPSTPSSGGGAQIRTPTKKPSIGQKKPYEVTGPTMQLPSKKQKVAGGLLDQSIDQLNDVTAVSGVNLREEEEQLLAGPKEDSRATEAMRRVVQEEEERLILQKGPLHNKIAGIMAKCGIKNASSDVERCLSMCVEERLRTMLSNLIRLSKQRVDLEKSNHRVTFTSDVRRQILLINKKAKEDWEKKQAEEAEKLRKLNEAENNGGVDGEKDEARAKAQRAQKEEEDKLRANAANVAARAAVGGDDVLSKWQLMAEQARQKREGASDVATNTTSNREANRRATAGGLKSASATDHQEGDNKGLNTATTGILRNMGRNLGQPSQTKPVRTISLKDVIALLEREPQMSKSTLLYRLFERRTDYGTEKGTENRSIDSMLQ